MKKLIWRNFCKKSWGKNLQISTLCEKQKKNIHTWKIFRESSIKCKFVTRSVDFTEFLGKVARKSTFLQFSHYERTHEHEAHCEVLFFKPSKCWSNLLKKMNASTNFVTVENTLTVRLKCHKCFLMLTHCPWLSKPTVETWKIRKKNTFLIKIVPSKYEI